MIAPMATLEREAAAGMMSHGEWFDRDGVHVWYAAPERVLVDHTFVRRYLALLDADETRRFSAFRFDSDRRCFLVAHALLRMALSRYIPVAPSEWKFDRNEYGRPMIAGPRDVPPISFSLSYTNGMVACAVSLDAEVGVDVEAVSHDTPVLELAERYFAATEHQMLRRTPRHARSDRFYAIWTLKEAYIKARGMGLSLPLDGFAFEIGEPGNPDIRFRDDFDDTPDAWRFVLKRLGPGYVLALAVRRSSAADMPIYLRPAEWI